MTFSSTFRLTYRDIAFAVVIMLLAFVLRVMVTVERAERDVSFAPLPSGSDQYVYVLQAEGYEAGTWPSGVFHWQPGITYFLIAIRPIFGRGIGQMTLGMALISALGCGFMVGCGWLLTRRRWGGYLAGLLMAVYPIAIFYSTVLLTESLSSIYLIVFLFLVFWQREKLSLWRSIFLGVLLGLMTITRTNLAALSLAWLLLLWLDTRGTGARAFLPARFVVHAGVSLLCMGLMIAPVALWNRAQARSREFPLITDTGMEEVYRGNNRDATGLRSTDPAFYTADNGYTNALLSDIRLNPLRFVELQLRKVGLYWSAAEPGNNVDYQQSGEAVSPLLRAIPLDFALVAFLGWLGIIVLWKNERRAAFFLALIHGLIFAGVMLVWAEGRLKQPAVPVLILPAAHALLQGFDLAARRLQPDKRAIRRYGLPALILLIVGSGLGWAAENLPQNRPVAGLPSDARTLGVTFGDSLKLLAWRTLPDWPAAQRGWTHFQRSYVVQLYWQVMQPTSDDYNVYLAYIQDGQRLAGVDRAIGTVSFRPKPTSQWQPGDIYAEVIGFQIPKDLPLEKTGEIRLGIYTASGETNDPNRVILPVPTTSTAEALSSIALERLAIFDTGYIGTELDGFTPLSLDFGGQIALKGYTLSLNADPGEVLTLGLYWKALADMETDYTLLVHLEDDAGNPVAQFDTPPRANTLTTSTWPPDYPISDAVTMTMPSVVGTYSLYIGWYNPVDGQRVTTGTPDSRVLLSRIRVN